jgi:acetoin utilization deacetylase AcuC-like enzyme
MRTALCYDRRFLAHLTGPGHPERPERLQAALERVSAQPWADQLHHLAPTPAALDWIARVHRLDYIRRAEQACALGSPFLDTRDVAICPASFEVAILAAGAALTMADAVIGQHVDNAFALVRPPGHHAENATAMGFCLFNNVAILARYLQQYYGLDKIAILDWDVHHGNGTQHTFEEDPSVLYVSAHQYPYYPGTGSASEIGTGRGRGATLNCPMPAGASDAAYERAFMEQILPTLDLFKPEAIIVSAGFDAHRDDPLADIALTTGCFRWMTERVMECADQHAQGRILSVLEGGYDLDRLSECVTAHLATLSGNSAG